MNRRSLLRGLLGLPFVGVAVKHAPKAWIPWEGVRSGVGMSKVHGPLGGGRFPIGTIDKYASSSSTYTEIDGLIPGTYKVTSTFAGVDGSRIITQDIVSIP